MTENQSEVTQRLDAVIAEVRKLEESERRREVRDRKRATKQQARQPVEWSAALVLIVFALCVLAGFVSYLYLAG